MKEITHTILLKPRSKSPFPLDMLRYDSCYPEGESDAGLMARTFEYGDYPEKPEIRVRRKAPLHWNPTADRWASFGWEVIRHDTIKY